jgi:hypothetical protein
VNPPSPADGAGLPIVKPDADAAPQPSDASAPDATDAIVDQAPADATIV